MPQHRREAAGVTNFDRASCVVDQLAIVGIAVNERFPRRERGAYRQVPACPLQALLFMVLAWDPRRGSLAAMDAAVLMCWAW